MSDSDEAGCALQLRESPAPVWTSFARIGEALGFRFQADMSFESDRTRKRLIRQCQWGRAHDRFEREIMWLGVLHRKEITAGKIPKVSIRWVDEHTGHGLFAEQNFPAGAFLGIYAGEVQRLPFLFPRSSDYSLSYPTRRWSWIHHDIEAQHRGNHTRFINHAQNANVDCSAAYVEPLLHAIIRTTRDVQKDEELRFDYGPQYWRRRGAPREPDLSGP